MHRVWVRAPDHLGDGVQAMPALVALGARRVAGPRWVEVLYRDLDVQRVDRPAPGDLAVLLKPSFSAAWQARRAARRVGLRTDWRRFLLDPAVPPPSGHRSVGYAAVVRAAVGREVTGEPAFAVREGERAAARARLHGPAVLLLPGTASPATVRWTGYAALAAALAPRFEVRAAGGPEDDALVTGIAGNGALPSPTLPELAALAVEVIAGGGAVVGNDSGLTHLAAAAARGAGLDTGAVHVVYGSTDPERTGPPGTRAWWGERPICWPCEAKRCASSRDGRVPCLDAPWQPLAAAILGAGHG